LPASVDALNDARAEAFGVVAVVEIAEIVEVTAEAMSEIHIRVRKEAYHTTGTINLASEGETRLS
tara:strand:- start:903 stop:1097 length:195 start_codon:yes stop_codon:yes gene_type:complete